MPDLDRFGSTAPTVAIDVQHLYRTGLHARDRGTRFRLQDGRTIYEADAVVSYAQALGLWLTEAGATVITNDPVRGRMVGPYSRRQREARTRGCELYLACHLNAGGGNYSRVEMMSGLPAQTQAQALACGRWIQGSLAYLTELRTQQTAFLRHGDRGAVCIEGCGLALPALLLEPFFGDTPRHQALLSSERLAVVGQLIGHGVAAWWRATHAPP